MYVFLFFKINFGVCCSGFIINAYNKTVSFETVPKRENKQIPVKFMTSKHLGYRSRDHAGRCITKHIPGCLDSQYMHVPMTYHKDIFKEQSSKNDDSGFRVIFGVLIWSL